MRTWAIKARLESALNFQRNFIRLGSDERSGDFHQRPSVFVDDSLLRTDVTNTHHRHSTSIDEELSPMLENLDVLIWLHLIHPDLAQLVK